MRIGPLHKDQIEPLAALFESTGIQYEIKATEDPTSIRTLDERKNSIQRYNLVYLGPSVLIYVDIADSGIPLVRGELEAMQLLPPEGPEISEKPEYLCVVCDFLSENPALCPTHKLPLLEFSVWTERKRHVHSSKSF